LSPSFLIFDHQTTSPQSGVLQNTFTSEYNKDFLRLSLFNKSPEAGLSSEERQSIRVYFLFRWIQVPAQPPPSPSAASFEFKDPFPAYDPNVKAQLSSNPLHKGWSPFNFQDASLTAKVSLDSLTVDSSKTHGDLYKTTLDITFGAPIPYASSFCVPRSLLSPKPIFFSPTLLSECPPPSANSP